MLKKLYDLNQVAKNLSENSEYFLYKGRVFDINRYYGISYIDGVENELFDNDKIYKIIGSDIYNIMNKVAKPKTCGYEKDDCGNIIIFPETFKDTKAISCKIEVVKDRTLSEYSRICKVFDTYVIEDAYIDITEHVHKFVSDKRIRFDYGDEKRITLVKSLFISYAKSDKVFFRASEIIPSNNGDRYTVEIKQEKSKMVVVSKLLCVKF